jgi:hypothetical protein
MDGEGCAGDMVYRRRERIISIHYLISTGSIHYLSAYLLIVNDNIIFTVFIYNWSSYI